MTKLVILDFDGTLADTRELIVQTNQEVQRRMHYPVADEAYIFAKMVNFSAFSDKSNPNGKQNQLFGPTPARVAALTFYSSSASNCIVWVERMASDSIVRTDWGVAEWSGIRTSADSPGIRLRRL